MKNPIPFLLILVALLLSCAFAQRHPDKNTLVVAQSVAVTTLDPGNVDSIPEANVANHIFATLV